MSTAAIQPAPTESSPDDDIPEVSGFIAGILQEAYISSPGNAEPVLQSIRSNQTSTVNVLPVPHYVYCEQLRKWKQQAPKPSPTIEVSLAVDKEAYSELNLVKPDLVKKPGSGFARDRRATLDSGAQLTVANEDELHAMVIKMNSIFPLALSVNNVTHSSTDLIGGVFIKISTYDNVLNVTRSTRQLCYISRSVRGIYLSEEACSALGYIPDIFPNVTAVSSAEEDKCTNGSDSLAVCNFPRRTLPPSEE